MDVPAALEECDSSVDVFRRTPPEHVRVTVAARVAPHIEHQDAVTVPGERARLGDTTGASREDDDGGAVTRGDIAAVEVEPIGGADRHGECRHAEINRRHRFLGPVRRHQRDAHGYDEPVDADHGGQRQEQPAQVPMASAPRAPQQEDTQRNEREPGRSERESRPVVAAYADGTGMGDRQCGAFESKRAESERDEGAQSGANASEQEGDSREQRERGNGRDEMVAEQGNFFFFFFVLVAPTTVLQKGRASPEAETNLDGRVA